MPDFSIRLPLYQGSSRPWLATVLLALVWLYAPADTGAQDPLPSWNPGVSEQEILDFVAAVTTEGSPDYVPPPQRIAVFDNDGTLWVEQPYYTQLGFMLDRVKALVDQHPEWRERQPFKGAMEGDLKAVLATGHEGLLELVSATGSGMSVEEFTALVEDWMAKARHPRFERPYTRLVYQPMLELLEYLRAHGFHTWIVSGGGIAFMRPWTEWVYGIPPEQVIGSTLELGYKLIDGRPTMIHRPEIAFVDDKAGKPIGIQYHIGRRPILAFGNSDGDLQMLEYTTGGSGRRLGLIVHHDDAEREYAYDRESHFGKLDKALDAAPAEGWVVVSMKSDWSQIFPPQAPATEVPARSSN